MSAPSFSDTAASAAGAPLRGPLLWFAAIVLTTANFVAVLDMTIANVSVASITGSLGISSSQGTWIITSYAVAEAIVVPLTGWLAARFGAVRCACSLPRWRCSACSPRCAAWRARWRYWCWVGCCRAWPAGR